MRAAEVRLRPLIERLLPFWFFAISLFVANATLAGDAVGLDTRIYRMAALEVLAGGDPWAARYGPYGFAFAGPPPTLIAALPLAVVPENVAVLVWMVVLMAAAVITVRALALPWWWLLFPPIVDSVLVGNADILAIALLAGGGRLAGALAPLFKVYALVPLAVLGRWRTMLVAVALVLLSLPLWSTYLPQAGTVAATLAEQSRGGFSAYGSLLVLPAVVALLLLPRPTSAWLIVPAIWPYTQFHYSCIALPALGAVSAFAMALPIRGLPAMIVIAMAILALWRALAEDDVERLGPLGRELVRRWRRSRASVAGADPQTAA